VEVAVQLARRQIYAYVALAVVVAALGVRYLVLPRQASADSAPALVLSAPTPSGQASASPGAVADVVVYVCGAVRDPGVIRLPAGARVGDAIELAGGATAKAELSAVNLAAKVADGQQIVVPEKAAPGSAAGALAAGAAGAGGVPGAPVGAAAAGALVNLNTASLTELESLSGVGPSTAQKIIDYRTANGGFASIEQLMEVPGIGDAKFAAVKDSITI
jgi:competence protein ComEA